MGKVQLPYIEPMYSTYHWMASSGIPAKQNSTSDNWFYNNTVEWRCTRKFLQGFTTPEMSLHTGNIWSMPFLEKSGINARFARRCALDLIFVRGTLVSCLISVIFPKGSTENF